MNKTNNRNKTVPVFSDEMKEKAFEESFNNRMILKNSKVCGCYNCLRIFNSAEVQKFITTDTTDSAVCPRCGYNAIIGESTEHPVSKEFLQAMESRFFECDDYQPRSKDDSKNDEDEDCIVFFYEN